MLALVFITGFVMATPPESKPIDHYRYLTSIGAPGQKPGQFLQPMAMAFSPDKRMLAVCDTNNNRLCLFYVDPEPGVTEALVLRMIYGDIWPWENRVNFRDSFDKYRERDFLEGRIKYPPVGRAYQGHQARVRPGEMVPIDHYNLPRGVTWLGTDTILIADTQNHRVKALGLNGEVKWILGQEGWKNGYFHHPIGIHLDKNNRLYVTEPRSNYIRGLGMDFLQRQRTQGNRLQIFSEKLEFEKRLGHMHRMSGRHERQFKDLTAVWVSDNSEIFVADNGNHRIMVYDENFEKLHQISSWPYYKLRYPNGIDGNNNGNLAIADTGNHRVLILNDKYQIKQVIGSFGSEPGKFSRPVQARWGPKNYLYILNAGSCRIDIYQPPQNID